MADGEILSESSVVAVGRSGERNTVDLNACAFACFGRWTRPDELFGGTAPCRRGQGSAGAMLFACVARRRTP
jgi:hypothetical protein